MKLASYLEGKSAAALARMIGVPTSTITRLAKGERKPSLLLASRIVDATDGEVSLIDMTPAPKVRLGEASQ